MPNEHGKVIDKTFLSVEMAERRGFLHRDYIAHCLRWSHIVKFLYEKQKYKDAYILDIGCGKEAPLIKTLYTSRLMPDYYLGVDYGPIVPSIDLSKFDTVKFIQNKNILDITAGNPFTLVVMFEVLEHMEKEQGIEVLKHIKTFMDSDATLFLSTPCYNGKDKAANHVYEWEFNELLDQLCQDYKILNVWGTFASMADYKPLLMEHQGLTKIFALLHEYYDTNVLACIFAPLFPKQSRNALWKLQLI